MSKFSVYSVGRSTDSDITLEDPSVSRVHAELTVDAEGRFYLIDCGSSGGTYLYENGAWARLQQSYVNKTDKVRFGQFQTSIQDLAVHIKSAAGKGKYKGHRDSDDPRDALPSGPVRRDATTGEIIGSEHD